VLAVAPSVTVTIRYAYANRLPELPPRRCHCRVASARAHLLAVWTWRAHQEWQAGEANPGRCRNGLSIGSGQYPG
jgi:hypothetical protein